MHDVLMNKLKRAFIELDSEGTTAASSQGEKRLGQKQALRRVTVVLWSRGMLLTLISKNFSRNSLPVSLEPFLI